MRAFFLTISAFFLGTCTATPPMLDQVLTLGELRVVTRNSPVAFYIGPDGRPRGLEYELAKRFATELGVAARIYAVPSLSDILPEVATGRAHFAAAGLTVTDKREQYVKFGPSYQQVRQQLVYRVGSGRPRSIEALIGRHVEVLAGSSHVETLNNLRHEYPDLCWVENPNSEGENLMVRVSTREIDYTVADSTEFAIVRNYRPDIRVAFDPTKADSLAWAFARGDDNSLVLEAWEFFQRLKQSGEMEQLLERYYGHTTKFDYVGTRSYIRHIQSRLPEYREWFMEAEDTNKVDWRLLAAIGYQESHWNPRAKSPTGVRGIMMLTQATARYLGVSNRLDPEQSIFGGAEYFAELKYRLPDRIAEPDRTWLTLAAYNVGLGHLEDARILTERAGKDPDLWADVREHLPLLAQKKYYSTVKRGYARGREPVLYVNNIRRYYDILQWMATEHGQRGSEQDGDLPNLTPVDLDTDTPPVET